MRNTPLSIESKWIFVVTYQHRVQAQTLTKHINIFKSRNSLNVRWKLTNICLVSYRIVTKSTQYDFADWSEQWQIRITYPLKTNTEHKRCATQMNLLKYNGLVLLPLAVRTKRAFAHFSIVRSNGSFIVCNEELKIFHIMHFVLSICQTQKQKGAVFICRLLFHMMVRFFIFQMQFYEITLINAPQLRINYSNAYHFESSKVLMVLIVLKLFLFVDNFVPLKFKSNMVTPIFAFNVWAQDSSCNQIYVTFSNIKSDIL